SRSSTTTTSTSAEPIRPSSGRSRSGRGLKQESGGSLQTRPTKILAVVEHHSRGGRMAQEPGKIRNVAVVGHRGTGKTSLAEAMLFQAGATTRLGTIDAGSTVSDWDEDEQRRKMSLAATICHLEWQGRKINLVDTPGDAGFVGDAIAAIRVVEGALFVVS